ncbi:Skn-1-like basic-leucine zipper transcription factor [Phycomyces blakesleeanus]|uniref:Skn-1-like basic-leucine zipper transcription factor n=1 Tax=Phycomyces blakesleeanus TaxID=4837 RepID=A0ABR3BC32_PHYBL
MIITSNQPQPLYEPGQGMDAIDEYITDKGPDSCLDSHDPSSDSQDQHEPYEQLEYASSYPQLPPPPPPLPLTTKLDEEPNPFEQSFSTPKTKHSSVPLPILPPASSIVHPNGPGKDAASQLAWDSLHSGSLSPSMLQGPAKGTEETSYMSYQQQNTHQHNTQTAETHALYVSDTYSTRNPVNGRNDCQTSFINHTKDNPPSSVHRRRSHPAKSPYHSPKANASDSENGSGNKLVAGEEEKRKHFLERNRQAALKCRQRKKEWLKDLQTKVDYLSSDNEQLQLQSIALREELLNLKTLLLSHRDCPINQRSTFEAIHRPLPTLAPHQPPLDIIQTMPHSPPSN